jgi:hypothetical protein
LFLQRPIGLLAPPPGQLGLQAIGPQRPGMLFAPPAFAVYTPCGFINLLSFIYFICFI